MSKDGAKPKRTGIQVYPSTVIRLRMLGATGKTRGKNVTYDLIINLLCDYYEGKNKRVSKLGEKLLADEQSGSVWLEQGQ
mgnify:CR=1 FL=1